jgi:membrane-bound ClpP family serine protease
LTFDVKPQEIAKSQHNSNNMSLISTFTGNWLLSLRQEYAVSKSTIILLTIGWILSPFTLYNDSFVNIPIAMGIAYLCNRLLGWNFIYVTGIAYIGTNILGLLLIGLGIRRIKAKLQIPYAKLIFNSLIFFIISIVIAYLINKLLLR